MPGQLRQGVPRPRKNSNKTQDKYAMELLNFQQYPKEPVLIDDLSVTYMKQAAFVPLDLAGNILAIAMAEPDDRFTIDAMQMAYGFEIIPKAGRREDIIGAIDRLYGSGSHSMEKIIEEADRDVLDITAELDDDVNHLRDMASEAPIIRLVNRLIINAVEIKASDIHFEPFENEFKVRYRLDGVLHEVENPPTRLQAAIISRVKIMAKLDIAERRLPQDGRIKLKIGDKNIDFRVSTLPTLFGESLVLRILDRDTLILELDQLGFSAQIRQQYEELITQPYGMILVTGPTGSGKTSTLYTTLAKINSPALKIIALEDPVEYQLAGINQIQVNPKIGLNFSGGLRSIVRQDPDVILVGEIRDQETAQIAIQSALTGHLLFSTLHTNDAAGAVTRLLDMGVENFLLSSTLLGILAQRLVRVNCPACKKEITPAAKLLKSMRLSEDEVAAASFMAGEGCEECRHTGFQGRRAIFEYLPVDETIRREINRKATTEEIKDTALSNGMTTLRQDGWRMVREGLTTIPEILRVTLEK